MRIIAPLERHLALLRSVLVLSASTTFAGCVASGTADPSQASPVRPTETTVRGERPPDVQPVQPPAQPSAVDPPIAHRASRLVLTPLSTVRAAPDGRDAIDLRLDALDEAGARTRMAGEIRIVLRAKGCDPLYSAFDLQILTKAQEAKHWDATLEQYVLRVEPNWKVPPAEGARIEVTVTLSPTSGPSLETSGAIEWRRPA